MATNDEKFQTDDFACLSFGKRYLALGVSVYLTAVFIALNTGGLAEINTALFLCFSLLFAALTGGAVLALRICFRSRPELKSMLLPSFVIILIVILAFCRVYFFRYSHLQKSAVFKEGVRVVGIVKNEPSISSTGKTFSLDLDALQICRNNEEKLLKDEHLITLSVASDNSIPKYGDCISAIIDSDFYSNAKCEVKDRLLQSKIVFRGYSQKISAAALPENCRTSINAVEKLGMTLREAILRSCNMLSYGQDEKALLEGLLIGETSGFSDELYADYTSSGFIHIASVSGMHTSYLFLALSFLFGLLKLRKRIIAALAIPFILIFCAVALFTPSVCRAATMLIVLLFGQLLRRRGDGITSLAFAAAILVTANPFCLNNYSFLMSFGATLGLLIYSPLIENRLSILILKPNPSKAKLFNRVFPFVTKYCTSSVCLSLAATLGLAFFTMSFFGKLQWGAIIGNIIVFPITAFAFIGGFINAAIFCISENAAAFLAFFFINPSLKLMNITAHFFSADCFTLGTSYLPGFIFPAYIIFCIIIYVLLQKEPNTTC